MHIYLNAVILFYITLNVSLSFTYSVKLHNPNNLTFPLQVLLVNSNYSDLLSMPNIFSCRNTTHGVIASLNCTFFIFLEFLQYGN